MGIFKVTAKNCKELADKANDDTYSELLERIVANAREGHYDITCKLSNAAKSRLEAEGFLIVSCAGDSWRVSWQ